MVALVFRVKFKLGFLHPRAQALDSCGRMVWLPAQLPTLRLGSWQNLGLGGQVLQTPDNTGWRCANAFLPLASVSLADGLNLCESNPFILSKLDSHNDPCSQDEGNPS